MIKIEEVVMGILFMFMFSFMTAIGTDEVLFYSGTVDYDDTHIKDELFDKYSDINIVYTESLFKSSPTDEEEHTIGLYSSQRHQIKVTINETLLESNSHSIYSLVCHELMHWRWRNVMTYDEKLDWTFDYKLTEETYGEKYMEIMFGSSVNEYHSEMLEYDWWECYKYNPYKQQSLNR